MRRELALGAGMLLLQALQGALRLGVHALHLLQFAAASFGLAAQDGLRLAGLAQFRFLRLRHGFGRLEVGPHGEGGLLMRFDLPPGLLALAFMRGGQLLVAAAFVGQLLHRVGGRLGALLGLCVGILRCSLRFQAQLGLPGGLRVFALEVLLRRAQQGFALLDALALFVGRALARHLDLGCQMSAVALQVGACQFESRQLGGGLVGVPPGSLCLLERLRCCLSLAARVGLLGEDRGLDVLSPTVMLLGHLCEPLRLLLRVFAQTLRLGAPRVRFVAKPALVG